MEPRRRRQKSGGVGVGLGQNGRRMFMKTSPNCHFQGCRGKGEPPRTRTLLQPHVDPSRAPRSLRDAFTDSRSKHRGPGHAGERDCVDVPPRPVCGGLTQPPHRVSSKAPPVTRALTWQAPSLCTLRWRRRPPGLAIHVNISCCVFSSACNATLQSSAECGWGGCGKKGSKTLTDEVENFLQT